MDNSNMKELQLLVGEKVFFFVGGLFTRYILESTEPLLMSLSLPSSLAAILRTSQASFV